MPTVVIAGKSVRLTPSDIVGSGGEADIYRLPGGRSNAVKLFKDDRHPDLANQPLEQEGARRRFALMQQKLLVFPSGLPVNVVKPIEMVRNQINQIIGFVMPFVDNVELLKRLSERSFRGQQNLGTPDVLRLFRSLLATVQGVHRAGAVIGDFNDLNVLFRGEEVWLIDADSMQWGKFPCLAYTQAFVDPLLCDHRASVQRLARPHTVQSDWYAFAVMLMRSLLYVGPFGGIYRPSSPAKRIPPPLRPHHRITVFHPDVVYPKPGIPLDDLPPDLYDYFRAVFVDDRREDFPITLLDERLWTKKGARVLVVLQPAQKIHGTVTATVVFETEGRIVLAAMQNGKLRVLHHDDGAYLRENGKRVVGGEYDPQLRYRLQGDATLMAKKGKLVVVGGEPTRHSVDQFNNLPIFDATENGYYWVENGRLMGSDSLVGHRSMGGVLSNRTLMWAGPAFGFGLWYAGELQQGFVFDARSAGINSTIPLDRIPGQLLGATTVFGGEQAWFLVQYQDKGKTFHRTTVVSKTGQIMGRAEFEEPGEDHWLHTIYGHAAVSNFLFAATDGGVVAVRVEDGDFVTTLFPDTAPFVSAGSKLLAFLERKQINLMVVGERQVVRLSIGQ